MNRIWVVSESKFLVSDFRNSDHDGMRYMFRVRPISSPYFIEDLPLKPTIYDKRSINPRLMSLWKRPITAKTQKLWIKFLGVRATVIELYFVGRANGRQWITWSLNAKFMTITTRVKRDKKYFWRNEHFFIQSIIDFGLPVVIYH